MNEMDFNPDAPLHIRSVSHLTIPVKAERNLTASSCALA
jgi:hypothetical protein